MNIWRFGLTAFIVGTIWSPAQAQIGNNDAVLNPNTAEEDQIAAALQLDDSLVAVIVDGRPFANMVELDTLLGTTLDEQERETLYAALFIPINLNSASEAEILLIPGMSERMAHEFEEYRPYMSLIQFRQEIGKYVNEVEVARLEQYVFVPLNLNSASREDLARIPGMDDRMVREFLEYRPYENMEQFRREIGKYVDAGEVTRLERYVTIR